MMQSLIFKCPTCNAMWSDSLLLERQGDMNYSCPACQQDYHQVEGITSLVGPTYQQTSIESDLVRNLQEKFSSATYEELVRLHLSVGETTDSCRTHYLQYELNLHHRSTHFYQMFQSQISQQGWSIPGCKIALDVGCGTGTGLLALAPEFDHVIGVDIQLSSLLIAKKCLAEANIKNVTLIHASAHQLPFDDSQFDFVMSINVLEHLFTPVTMLTEVARVLQSGGIFCGDSRNRYDLLFPEPHVQLHWVGFLPRQWMEPYVRWRLGVAYDHTYLLSYDDLGTALCKAFELKSDKFLQRKAEPTHNKNWAIRLPDVAAYGISKAIQRRIQPILNFKPIQSLLIRIFPSHIALARKL